MGSQDNRITHWFQEAFAAHNRGELEEAVVLYQKVLHKMPSHMEVLYLLGTACSQLGKFEEAERLLKKALSINPAHPEALNNLGLTLRSLGRAKDAIEYYRRAIRIKPDYADAYGNLGGTLEFLGELSEAENQLRHALQLNPDLADAHYNLGLVLRGKDRFEEASECFLRGLELKPDFPAAYCDLGAIYKMWGRYDEARTCLEKALSLAPDFSNAQINLGSVLEELGMLEEALAAYEKATELNPDDITARWNMAFLYLKQGILDRGWMAHELRFEMGMAIKRFFYPDWDGSPLAGKRILAYAEQGVGDEVLFASCFPDLIARAGHCIIECDPRLSPLFERSFPSATIVGFARNQTGWLSAMPEIDLQIAEGSLPRFFRPTLDSFPDGPAYLFADPKKVEYWRSRIAALGPGLKIGICWRSGFTKGERHKYYSQLSEWGNIFGARSVQFVNLQYDECTEELLNAEKQFGVRITSFPDLDLKNDLDESAALMKSLDLVISAGTAVVAIAAALGVETWCIEAEAKPWTALGTDRLPWFPSLKLFRKAFRGDWNTTLALVGEALKEKISGHANVFEYAPILHDVEIAINTSPEDMATYVLKEQEGWFDPEYGFVLETAAPGMHIVDVGAGIGAYSLPLAKRGGRILALTRTAKETRLIVQSRLKNRLDNAIDVSISEHAMLDAEMDRYGLDDIAFVRISPEFSAPPLLQGAERFFRINSPLVQFGIQPGNGVEMAEAFKTLGYDLYRLVPGLDRLVPFISTEDLDAFSLNLFACKPDRANLLEKQDLLCRSVQPLENFPGIDQSHWQQYLGSLPYARNLMQNWLSPKEQVWEVHWMALNLFSMAKSVSRTTSERYACMEAAFNIMKILVEERVNLPRLLSFCRILTELGRREMAVNLLNHICALLDSGMEPTLCEPFLALSAEYERTDPGEHPDKWIVAMVLEQRERLRAFSSFFTGKESLPILEEIQKSGFLSKDMARRMELIRARFAPE